MTLPPDKEVSFKESVNLSFDMALTTLEMPEGLGQYIRNVNNVYQVRFPVKINGKLETFIGWQHNSRSPRPAYLAPSGYSPVLTPGSPITRHAAFSNAPTGRESPDCVFGRDR